MARLETLSEEIQEKKFRHFMLLLYKDSDTYNYDDVLFDLKGSFKNYAYIEHQPETNEKKEHTHFILSLDNPRSIRGLSKRVGVSPNYIQSIKSLRASCRYLIHIDDDDEKTKYELTDVNVSPSFSRKYFASFDDLKTDEDVIDDIYLYIDTLSDLSFRDAVRQLIKFVSSQAYDTIYKRYRIEFTDYLRDILSENRNHRHH